MDSSVHRYSLTTRAGKRQWTAASLQAWIGVLTGHQVTVTEVSKSQWFVPKKVVTFEVVFEGTPAQARDFLGALRQQFKVDDTSLSS